VNEIGINFFVFLVFVNELGTSCEGDRHELCGTKI
jgi:hypothetical protein